MKIRSKKIAKIACVTLAALAISPTANAAQDGDTVYMYCIGNPPVSVRSSHAYFSNVFSHRLDVMGRSVDRETSDFRDEVDYQFNQPIGATCHYFDTWDDAEYERDATIQHRRNNGYTIDYVNY